MNTTFDIPTVDVSLYRDYKAGKLTLKECACKFHECGWDNYVNETATQRRFNRIENSKWHLSPPTRHDGGEQKLGVEVEFTNP